MALGTFRRYAWKFVLIIVIWISTLPTASAIQLHESPEGYIVHQMAHVFFLIAMVYLISRLALQGDLREQGWFEIAIAAGLFALWNVDTILVHFLIHSYDPAWVKVSTITFHQTVELTSMYDWAIYLGQMDYMLSVPGIAFLYKGLRSFSSHAQNSEGTRS